MRYGHFDDAAKEYVIDRPDTPKPWSNYLGSRKYGGIITNNAGGYSFSHSPAEGRFLRLTFNNVPLDQPGRYFYLRDRDSGDIWSSSWQPVGKPLDQYQSTCRFGTGYAVIDSLYSNIRSESTYFVPLDQEFEVWRLKLTNTAATTRRISTFAFAAFVNEWNIFHDAFNLQYSQYIGRAEYLGDGLIAASMCGNLPTDPANFANRDQSRHWWMGQTGILPHAHDLDRDAFIGPYNGFHNPRAVLAGNCGNSTGCADNLCGALQTDLDLAPGETRELAVFLGIGRAQEAGRSTLATFRSPARLDEELHKLKIHWHGLLEGFACQTPDAEFDSLTNVWGAYNALMTFIWSRACSLVYTGDQRDGLGFRDSVQDTLGVTHLIPDQVRERLALLLTGQESTGGARPEIKPWLHRPGSMPLTDPERYRSDDCLWFFNSIPAYVAETGDSGFYRTVLPYSDKGEDTVFGHLKKALLFNLERTGKNGLPCGLEADWNDCLKLGYHGESVFVTFQLRLGLSVYAQIAHSLGETAEATWAEAQRTALDTRIQQTCWDGGWFIWAVGEDGTVYGSKNFPEGQIYLNSQCWAVLSDAANPVQARTALDAVRDRLATEYGVMLCDPPFARTSVKVMRAVLFIPGTKENGGIFSHTQSWAVMAEARLGRGDQAYTYYRAFMPSAYNDRAEIREIEPYVHCQSTHGRPSSKFGASRVPWLSGTASWSYYCATQTILGIIPQTDGLRIDPCIPSTWPAFTAQRRFRGRWIHVHVENPQGVCSGIIRLEVDGHVVEGNVIPEARLKDGSRVRALLGGRAAAR
jgi:cellobiose phosphorylase